MYVHVHVCKIYAPYVLCVYVFPCIGCTNFQKENEGHFCLIIMIGKQKGLHIQASELMVEKVRERGLLVQCTKEKAVVL